MRADAMPNIKSEQHSHINIMRVSTRRREAFAFICRHTPCLLRFIKCLVTIIIIYRCLPIYASPSAPFMLSRVNAYAPNAAYRATRCRKLYATTGRH